jgi:hypothetical protein
MTRLPTRPLENTTCAVCRHGVLKFEQMDLAHRPENHVKLHYRCESCHCIAVDTLDAKTVSEVLDSRSGGQ